MKNIIKKIGAFDLALWLNKQINKRDIPFWHAFLWTFAVLSTIFLYHGVHFLFGDHDWKYLREGLRLNDGLFEGRFSQFLYINAATSGEILPIINNLLGFLGFVLGLVCLAKYWQIPHKKSSYLIFTLFCALTPYILSFMYFAFLIAPVLSWNVVVIISLLISEKEQYFSFIRTIVSAILIMLALGGYPPVINLFAVAFITRLCIAYIDENKSIPVLAKNYRWTIINLIIGVVLYKLVLVYFTHTGAINSSYYNLQTTPVNEWPIKAWLTIKNLFLQFPITLPFITAPYKIALIILTFLAFGTLYGKRKTSLFAPFIIFASGMITFFLSTSIKETEFSPRIDFFGFMYATAAMLAFILKSNNKCLKNISYALVIFCLIINTHSLFEAQKVWKLGFDAEMNLYKRVSKRFLTANLFNLNNYYIIVQGGSPSFRKRFYHDTYQHESDDLLSISYVPGLASGVMWDYYAPKNFADKTSYTYTFQPTAEAKRQINEISVWPKEGSVIVGAYWILIALTQDGLNYLYNNYR